MLKISIGVVNLHTRRRTFVVCTILCFLYCLEPLVFSHHDALQPAIPSQRFGRYLTLIVKYVNDNNDDNDDKIIFVYDLDVRSKQSPLAFYLAVKGAIKIH